MLAAYLALLWLDLVCAYADQDEALQKEDLYLFSCYYSSFWENQGFSFPCSLQGPQDDPQECSMRVSLFKWVSPPWKLFRFVFSI